MQTSDTNRMRFAGSWYSADRTALEEQLEHALEQTTAQQEHLRGAVVPHAGLAFSARGMADAFARVSPEAIERVVLLAPSHYVRLPPDQLTSAPFTAHETPIGDIDGITGLPTSIRVDPDAVEREHAVELILPFIRHSLPGRPLATVLVPEISSAAAIPTLRDTLLDWLGETARRTLFLASSDFTHYGPRFGYTPFGTSPIEDVEQAVADDDQRLARAAAAGDTGTIFSRITEKPVSVCGRYPVLLLAELMNHFDLRGEHTSYYTSNDVHGRSTDFVCYATVVFRPEETA